MVFGLALLRKGLKTLESILSVDDHLITVLLVLQTCFKVHVESKMNCLFSGSNCNGALLSNFLGDFKRFNTR